MKWLIVVPFISVFFLAGSVYAPWSTLGTGYAITSDSHGVDLMMGVPVTVTAGTLDSMVTHVTFVWHLPNATVRWEVTVPVFTNGTMGMWNNGTITEIRFAQDTQSPDVMGDWGVQAFFQDSTGRDRAGLDDVIKIKSTSFNVIPEIPLGTVAAAATMLVAFGVFAMKRHREARVVPISQ